MTVNQCEELRSWLNKGQVVAVTTNRDNCGRNLNKNTAGQTSTLLSELAIPQQYQWTSDNNSSIGHRTMHWSKHWSTISIYNFFFYPVALWLHSGLKTGSKLCKLNFEFEFDQGTTIEKTTNNANLVMPVVFRCNPMH